LNIEIEIESNLLLLVRITVCIEFFLPIGWRTFINGKFRQVLHYSGLYCGMLEFLQIFFSRAVIQRPTVDFPAFLVTGLAEKIAVRDHTTRDPNK
jgi:hypothetical protein